MKPGIRVPPVEFWTKQPDSTIIGRNGPRNDPGSRQRLVQRVRHQGVGRRIELKDAVGRADPDVPIADRKNLIEI